MASVPTSKIPFDKLYQLETVSERASWFRPVIHESDIDDVFRGRRLPVAPVTFAYDGGSGAADLHETTHVSLRLVSQRFIETLKATEATGWSCYAVQAYNKGGDLIDGLSGLSVSGRCGVIVDNLRFPQVRYDCDGGYTMWVRQYFDTWDGSDIFSPGGFIYVTERVATALKKAKLKNVALELLGERANEC